MNSSLSPRVSESSSPRSPWRLFSLLALTLSTLVVLERAPQQAQAVALTTYLASNAKSCFYADVDSVGEKIGFYFAVQSGGEFEIDYEVLDPEERVVLKGEKERQGDYIFTANKVGEYSFCFGNDATMTTKLLDFDIMVESEPRRSLPTQAQGGTSGQGLVEQTSQLEESIFRLNGLLNKIVRTQKYFHTRHHRNHSTVISTQSRIFWYSILECVAVVGMSLLQIWILKTFFAKGGVRR